MKRHFTIFLSSSLMAIASATAWSASPILDSLQQQGVRAIAMTDAELDEIKGAALISGQPYPSVTLGLKQHFVTYKGWGSKTDYNSYNYIGNSYNPDPDPGSGVPGVFRVAYGGGIYGAAGDEWWADDKSSPNSWSRANAKLKETHYQILDPGNGYAPSIYALRDSGWNRPLTTFFW